MRVTRRGRLVSFTVRAPERVSIKVAAVLMGVYSLGVTPVPGGPRSYLSPVLAAEASALLIAGGVVTLWAVAEGSLTWERVGIALTALGAFTWAGLHLLDVPVRLGGPTVLLFTAIGAACAARLVVSWRLSRVAGSS